MSIRRVKLLYIADLHYTGYGTASINLLKQFTDPTYEITYYGINQHNPYYKEVFKKEVPHLHDVIMIDEKGYDDHALERRKLIGILDMADVVNKVQPDIILSLNDNTILTEQFTVVRNTKHYRVRKPKLIAYMPLDCGNFPAGFFSSLESKVDMVITMNRYSHTEIRNTGFLKPVHILEHAINSEYYKPINKLQARRKIWSGKYGSTFIVLNYNKSQQRKRLDITIDAFYRLYLEHKDVLLVFKEKDKEILSYIDKYNDPSFASHIIYIDKMLWPHELNELFNAVDVGINTAMGEGWGLVSCEHALCGIPQIVGNNTSQPEIFSISDTQRTTLSNIYPTFIDINRVIKIDSLPNPITRSNTNKVLGKLTYNPLSSSTTSASEIPLAEKNAYTIYVTNTDTFKHNGTISGAKIGNLLVDAIFTSFTNLYQFMESVPDLRTHKYIQVIAHIESNQDVLEDYKGFKLDGYDIVQCSGFNRDAFKVTVDVPTVDSTYTLLKTHHSLTQQQRKAIGNIQMSLINTKYNLPTITNKFKEILKLL